MGTPHGYLRVIINPKALLGKTYVLSLKFELRHESIGGGVVQ